MKSVIFMLCILLIGTNSAFSQKGGRGHGKGNGHGNVKNQRGTRVVVKSHPRVNRVVVRSKYRPAKIVVYHPHWRPNYGYHRRWYIFLAIIFIGIIGDKVITIEMELFGYLIQRLRQ